MVICQSSELGLEVTVELPADSLSIGRGSVNDSFQASIGMAPFEGLYDRRC